MTAIYPGEGIHTCGSFSTKLRRSSRHALFNRKQPTHRGLKLRDRIGFKRAAVAVARKLTVIMHTMLPAGT